MNSRSLPLSLAADQTGYKQDGHDSLSCPTCISSFKPMPSTDFFELTANPIDITSVARRVVPPECGATVTLDGYVRQITKGRETLHLFYEAYEPMALKEMEKLIEQAKRDFEISHVGIVHRLGKLEIGET